MGLEEVGAKYFSTRNSSVLYIKQQVRSFSRGKALGGALDEALETA
jgi:hypothetical protein